MCRTANKVIIESRGSYYTAKITDAAGDRRRRWTAIRSTLHQTEPRIVRSSDENFCFGGASQCCFVARQFAGH